MTNMLAAADRNKLLKVLGLLASDQPGEVAAAGAAACRLLRERGLDWGSIISDGSGPSVGPSGVASTAKTALFPEIQFLARRQSLMTARQAEFFNSVRQCRRLSPRQVEVLQDIVRRVAAREARA